MEFHVPDTKHCGFRLIHPRLAECLREMPAYLANLSSKAERRFFPSPAEDADADELRADWKAHVEPGLHDQFGSARDAVAADLRAMSEDDGTFDLLIPANHIDAWLNVLTQMRLALAEDFDIVDTIAASGDDPPDLSTPRGLAILQSELFMFMQECLVRHVE